MVSLGLKKANVFCYSDETWLWRLNVKDTGMDFDTLQTTHDEIWRMLP